jgi:hypothetical protein
MEIKCLDEELLADYLEDRLEADERSTIETHFSDCRRCRNEFLVANRMMQSRQYLQADPVPEYVTEAAVKRVAQLVAGRRSVVEERSYPFFQKLYSKISEHIKLIMFNKNRFAPVRGSGISDAGHFYRVRKMFKDILAEIEIEKAGHQTAAVRVTLINGFGNQGKIRVTLQNSHQREVASYPMRANIAIFENIPFGHYRLVFMQNKHRIGNYDFEIKESA